MTLLPIPVATGHIQAELPTSQTEFASLSSGSTEPSFGPFFGSLRADFESDHESRIRALRNPDVHKASKHMRGARNSPEALQRGPLD
eukprot:5823058-Alexandrium_andersonii.AAC.1